MGRLARQDVWEAAVSQALREKRFDEVSLLCDRHVPEWYRGGVRGWAHLRVSDDEWATVLEEATARSDAGTLWEKPPCCDEKKR